MDSEDLRSIIDRDDVPSHVKIIIEKIISKNQEEKKDIMIARGKQTISTDIYQVLIEKMEEGIIFENSQEKISLINPKITQILGYRKEELLGKHWREIVYEEEYNFVKIESDKRSKGIKSVYECHLKAKDGSLIPVYVRAIPIFSDDKEYRGVLVIITDIRERKQMIKDLSESRELYQMLVEKMEEGVFLEDANGIITFVNLGYAKMLGYDPNEIVGNHYTFVWNDESIKKVIAETEKRPKGISTTYEGHLKTKENKYIPVICTGTPLFSKNGKFKGVLSVFTDITAQKRVEKALRESKELYQMLVEKMEEGVILEDTNGFISFVNPKYHLMLGYSKEELLGKHFSITVPPEEREHVKEEAAKRPKGISSTYEISMLRKDGSKIHVIIRATPLFSESHDFSGVLCVFTDITERKKIEETLKVIKLEEERYHAMLSHFINNDLQKIINNLELISFENESKKMIDHNDDIYRIIKIASRSSKTIDCVNKIFEVLQLPLTHQKRESKYLLDIINKVISEKQSFSTFSFPIVIERDSLHFNIFCDKFFSSIFFEIMSFIFDSVHDTELAEDATITIEGSESAPEFCIIIRDSISSPILGDISSRLSQKITDDWEYQGHYIGLALVSVIMQHYGGRLKIKPLNPFGNEFQLFFPQYLISTQF